MGSCDAQQGMRCKQVMQRTQNFFGKGVTYKGLVHRALKVIKLASRELGKVKLESQVAFQVGCQTAESVQLYSLRFSSRKTDSTYNLR